jgi:HD-GYP domain-containing protein (c-di-GMP phosphodiesterase class II)
MSETSVRVLYLLHDSEHEPPRVLTAAADVVSAHPWGTPDLSALENPPNLIAVGTPLDETMTHELREVEALHLPMIGLGTGPSEHFAADVSNTITPADLRLVLNLVLQQSAIWRLDAESDDHPFVAKLLESVTDSVTRMIEHLMALRIPEYRKRTDRVISACEWIASHLGMTDEELKTLLYAACLREIGKLGLPDRILFTPLKERSEADQKQYNRYPELGAIVVSEFPSLLDAAHIIKCLLENFDGTGPEGLRDAQIPLASRILRVVSAYEMIADEIPESASAEEILTVLKSGKGSTYDPLLLRLVQNFHMINGEDGASRKSRLIRLADIVEGMVLAEDIWSRNGVKLIPQGTRITEHVLNLLQSGSVDTSLDSIEILKSEN